MGTGIPELRTGSAADVYIDLLKRCLTASIYDESAWKVIEPYPQTPGPLPRSFTGPLRRFVIRTLAKRRLLLVRAHPYDPAKRAKGEDWPCFAFTLIGEARLDNLEACVRDVLANGVPGDFIETGVWRGGAVIFMRAMLRAFGVTDRVVWAADSFEGMPEPTGASDGWDYTHTECLRVSLEQIKSNFARFGLLDDQVRFLKGWFRDTLPEAPIEKLALLRLDGDLYHSTMDALTNLYGKVSKGGYVIVDDYLAWPACRRAVHDFLDSRGLRPEIRKIDDQGAYWRVE